MATKFRSDDTVAWPYGLGRKKDGSTYAAPAIAGCSGTATSTTLTIDAASTFANDDLVVIKQTRGTGVGNYMFNRIVSGGGTTTLTLEIPLDETYTDSGASQAQVMEMKEYDNLDLASSTITPSGWDGNTGGIGGFFNMGTMSGTAATLNLDGGTPTGLTRVTGGGFRGGSTATGTGTANQGEGQSADGGASTAANGIGGGGGQALFVAGGGGGGHATSGGTSGSDASVGGTGGGTVGTASLTSIYLGGAGGGGRRDTGSAMRAGSNGGGAWFIFSEDIDLTGITVLSRGGAGVVGDGPGGGGAGGSVLIKAVSATLGTNKVLATGGAAAASSAKPFSSGAGGTGYIHMDISGSYTGTTSPTIDVTVDPTILPVGGSGGAWFMFM